MENTIHKEMLCPCRSKKLYDNCCKPFHDGQLPDTALQLMRSRYSAYALCLPDYIIHTTHRENPHYNPHTQKWAQEISEFSRNTEFKDLEILDCQENASLATVTFVAHLVQNNKDVSFTEKSFFEKIDGKWLYRNLELHP
jgi:SEC-C motif domain protein